MVQVLHHRHPAQQIGKDVLIAPVKGDQPVRHPHKAGLTGQGLPLPQGVGPNGRNGQDRRSAALPALEELNDGLAVLLPVHHNVLHGAAQGGLDGQGHPVRGLHQSGHRPVDALQNAPVRLVHHQLHRPGEALPLPLHVRQQPDAGGQGVLLHLCLHVGLFAALRLLPALLLQQGIALGGVAPLVQGLLCLVLLSLGLGQLGLGGGGLLLQLCQLPADGPVPVQYLLGRGGQGRAQGTGVGGIRLGQGLAVPQALQLLLQLSGGLSVLLHFLPLDLDGLGTRR